MQSTQRPAPLVCSMLQALGALALTGSCALATEVTRGPQLAQPQDRAALYDSLASEARETPIVRIVRAATPAVVFIQTEAYQQVQTLFGPSARVVNGAGSGVVIHPWGYVVTNYHVVEGARRITVSFDGDPGRYNAQLVSFVREEDLALLKILEVPESLRTANATTVPAGGAQPQVEFPTVRWGTSVDLMPGEPVVAIGNPHGQTYTVSSGIISGLHRDIAVPQRELHFHGLIQTDASINRGNSGGPLLNIRGELIGINSAMNEAAENIGYAIPVDRVKQVLTDALLPQARASWLGFEVAEDASLTVVEVTPDGPAQQAGICEGDVVIAIDGAEVTNNEEFVLRCLQVPPGGKVRVDVRHAGRVESRQLVAWEPLDGILFRRMGVTVSERQFGGRVFVQIDRIGSGGPAEQIGMLAGDLIPALRPEARRTNSAFRIQDREVLAAIVDTLDVGTFVELEVYRDSDGDQNYERLSGRLKLR
ncbi:MAG: trypsin-like peptidase domain-containing protein [Planctomycetota bacterium]